MTLATERRTYQSVWDDYAAGRMSTTVLRQLLDHDDVFRRWCVRKVEKERKARDVRQDDEDGA